LIGQNKITNKAMDIVIAIFALLLAGLAGAAIGYLVKKASLRDKTEASRQEAEKIFAEADKKAKDILLEAKNEALKTLDQYKVDEEKKRQQLEKIESRLLDKEESLEKKIQNAEQLRTDLEQKVERVKVLRTEAETALESQKKELEKIAGMSREEARTKLIKEVEETARQDLAEHILKAEEAMKKESKDKAKLIIADAIQRYAAEVATESTVTVVPLPSDELKGRIIGKEGRNVMAFEQATGIDVIIDDTPGSIVISGFDLVRRYIAKISLEKLLVDGRIHPARIEEVVAKTQEEVNIMIKDLGEKAAYETGVAGLNINLIKLLGRLKFRTSHGQNVLKHSMEVAYLAAGMAAEVGADPEICKKAGLLHDIGKSTDHEIQGHHAVVGKEILKKFNISEEVIHCVESHEGEVEPRTVEAMVVSAANAIANARPGAQKGNLENFVKRMEELENTVNAFSGVKNTFAVQAGSEVRIFVKPEEVDDYAAVKLTHDIARKIEKDLQYPGQIKLHLLRETRAEDLAK
jgi:ribonuclease Y